MAGIENLGLGRGARKSLSQESTFPKSHPILQYDYSITVLAELPCIFLKLYFRSDCFVCPNVASYCFHFLFDFSFKQNLATLGFITARSLAHELNRMPKISVWMLGNLRKGCKYQISFFNSPICKELVAQTM